MTEGPARGATAPLGTAVPNTSKSASVHVTTEPLPHPLDGSTQVTQMTTEPLPQAPFPARLPTQVSASAVPSTLESPEDTEVKPEPAGPRKVDVALAMTVDEVGGHDLAAIREGVARAAVFEVPSDRHPIGPPTLVSPGGVGAPVPYPPAPPQVPPAYHEAFDGPHAHGSFAPPRPQFGAAAFGGGGHNRAPRQGMSGVAIALIVVAAILALGGLTVVGLTVFVTNAANARRAREDQQAEERAARELREAREAREAAPAETLPRPVIPTPTTPPLPTQRAQPARTSDRRQPPR